MKVTVKLPIEIPEKTISELIQISAERLATDDEDIFKDGRKTISVVRCKDCKWFNYSRPNFCHFFGAFFGGMKEDDFCSRAERRNDA